jgi:D-alanyl-lipoteichoic acid acyltransferase DltB (MBOAT superfamily)
MLFNSGVFFGFFAAFLLLYFLVRHRLSLRNLLILAASYIFYGAWDYRFLFLLAGTSLMDFFVGRALDSTENPPTRKLLLSASICVNLAILGFFKYYDFFLESALQFLSFFNLHADVHALGIILPVGISFYTFQEMSYTIDVYRREQPAARNLVRFLAYVSFFPQLVAGPIERGAHLLPQFGRSLEITRPMLKEGLWLSIWGLFKKVVIADNLASAVDMVYGNASAGAPLVILGTLAFALQIYCDFSGYSDMARGLARLLGFDIMMNFNLPYTASNIREFWQRWHISLSTWLRDYLYIPLGGNRRGPARTYLNLLITMFLGGLWHGAKWTFVLWGLWHGLGLITHRLLVGRKLKNLKSAWKPIGWFLTLIFVCYGWLFFRADSLSQIASLNAALLDWTTPRWFPDYCLFLAVFATPLIAMETWQRSAHDLLVPLSLPEWLLALLEALLIAIIILFWGKAHAPFIYFQF